MTDRSFVIRVIVIVLAIASLAFVSALLIGLFNPLVDNAKIFEILQPMGNSIVGALISVFSALMAIKATAKKDDDGGA